MLRQETAAASAQPRAVLVAAATPGDSAAIEALLDEGFGGDRHGRTAYRLRAGATPVGACSFVARDAAALVGSAQTWDIALAADGGAADGEAADGGTADGGTAGGGIGGVPLLLLGPVAVAASHRGRGIGSALVAAVLEAVDSRGGLPVLLIGDAPFYGRFGFSATATGGWRMPGPVDAARLLLRGGAGLPLRARVVPAAGFSASPPPSPPPA